MPSPVDWYIEKLAALRSADQQAADRVNRVIQAAQAFGVPLGENWRSMVISEMPPTPIERAARMSNRRFPDWPSLQDVKNYVVAYQEALVAVCEAYEALTADQKAGVQPPPASHP